MHPALQVRVDGGPLYSGHAAPAAAVSDHVHLSRPLLRDQYAQPWIRSPARLCGSNTRTLINSSSSVALSVKSADRSNAPRHLKR
ncbi:hypothetical protein F2P81_015583 [Scophthalmus maximus]|uniref:Uncharacterized protein n=1 Tax=Scophthalmus maximus TaxID=52904 RepID=A0A6A4SGM9_SCOMX|nr:hypothetical protein F2P81_015583 [Scophthalmus maximus]